MKLLEKEVVSEIKGLQEDLEGRRSRGRIVLLWRSENPKIYCSPIYIYVVYIYQYFRFITL
jgi:hypothetical protein